MDKTVKVVLGIDSDFNSTITTAQSRLHTVTKIVGPLSITNGLRLNTFCNVSSTSLGFIYYNSGIISIFMLRKVV